MTAEEWQRVRPILESALELDAANRASFLDSACADGPLRREVESLLAAHEQGGTDFLSAGSLQEMLDGQEARFRLPPGKRVGPYEIEEELALGGMGTVYRAVRADGQYRQKVALKIVRAELGAEFTAARFRNERQILASLDHPNIAKILDGGTCAEGLPYLVMELIEGLPITEYCDQQKLSIDERVKLFRVVCSAVHYAHQHLVIHRDIKPGNIFVTADGVPKLLDFGIAKILDPSLLPGGATLTAAGGWLMTPEYASPEQFRGETITTATDIYSLGVVLYELLTGRLPYRLRSRSAHEMASAVCETEPDRPSTAVSRAEEFPAGKESLDARSPQEICAARQAPPDKLSRQLAGDLDQIVLKAIRKEPELRYTSAEQLAEDLRRHQEGLPVVARKGTVAYRARKYAVRNRVGVAAAALVALSLLTGLGFAMREARIARANAQRAEQRFNDVRTLANSLLFEVHDSIKDLAGATPARKLLVNKALQYLDSLSQEAAGDLSLQRELAAAYEKVGNVQGNPYDANLGDPAGAVASYRKALAIRESLDVHDGHSEESQRNLANNYEWIGMTLPDLGDSQGALEYFRKDLAIREALAKAAPNAKSQEALAGAYYLIGRQYAQTRNPEAALENYRKSAAIRESIVPATPLVQSRLAGTYSFMAGIVNLQGNNPQALELQRKALEIEQKLLEANPTNATYREYRDQAEYWLGYFFAKHGDATQALSKYRPALADFQALAAVDPSNVRIQEYLARCNESIGSALLAKQDLNGGLASIRKAVSMFEALPSPAYTSPLAEAHGLLGLAYARLAEQAGLAASTKKENWTRSREAYQQSLKLYLQADTQGEVSIFDARDLERVKNALAGCDAALARLGAPAR
jgi:non-specific serine/threonine protein kinase/serine/threonine-protein kinase